MTKQVRADFPSEVKRCLAARAGHRCSVCTKSTSGPGTEPETTVSDGVAAHITAASPGGPRYDPGLSPEERRSIANGIWVCTQHGREIDADGTAFSVELLRGLKRIREGKAERELQSNAGAPDHSVRLLELPHAIAAFELFETLDPQPYAYSTTAAVRELVLQSEAPGHLLDLAAEVILGIWHSHPNIAGILSTLLSTASEFWQPSKSSLLRLEALCDSAIQQGDWSRIGAVEPLAFALGTKGRCEIHRQVLERLIEERHWRAADAARTRDYYGTAGVQIAAILRHWHDPIRKGLLHVNDISRLMDMLLSTDRHLLGSSTHLSVLDLLEQHALALRDCGQVLLASRVHELVDAVRTQRRLTQQ
ncbi:MAG TPA: hypothetical protein VIV60_09585 [Polyangiaceae bacterium]